MYLWIIRRQVKYVIIFTEQSLKQFGDHYPYKGKNSLHQALWPKGKFGIIWFPNLSPFDCLDKSGNILEVVYNCLFPRAERVAQSHTTGCLFDTPVIHYTLQPLYKVVIACIAVVFKHLLNKEINTRHKFIVQSLSLLLTINPPTYSKWKLKIP